MIITDELVECCARAIRKAHDDAAGYNSNGFYQQLFEAMTRAALAVLAEHRADAISALLREREWRPIETAPKDGTRILVCRAGEDVGGDEIEITEWCVMKRDHYEHVEGDMYRKVQDEPYAFWNGNGHRATHWLPLPIPTGTL